jgi:prolipoprotein diacylglyceryltransferase
MTTWFDVIIYALGWVVLIYFAPRTGRAFGRVIWAFVCGFSICRWTLNMRRQHSKPRFVGPAWLALFFWSAIDCLSKPTPTISTRWGVWRDVGNWTVFPPKVTP